MLKVGIVGFYGWGNCGDESILGGICSQLYAIEQDTRVYIVSDLPFTFHDHYYNRLSIPVEHSIHTLSDINFIDELDLLLVGGGGLSPGFGFQQIFQCHRKGIPVINYGIDFREDEIGENALPYLSYFDRIIVRSKTAKGIIDRLGLESTLAFCPSYSANKVELSTELDNFILITPRLYEFDHERDQIDLILNKVSEIGKDEKYVLLPFSSTDITGKELDTQLCMTLLKTMRDRGYATWFLDIEGYKYKIIMSLFDRAKYVINTGRYHSALFSIFSAVPFSTSVRIHMRKMDNILSEVGGKTAPFFSDGFVEIGEEEIYEFKRDIRSRVNDGIQVIRDTIQ